MGGTGGALSQDEKKQAGFRLTKTLLQKLGHLAVDRDVSLNQVAEQALREWWNLQPESQLYGKLEVEAEKKG